MDTNSNGPISLADLKPSDIPSPPQSSLRIVRSASDENFTFEHIVQTISADPAFTSEILRTVNSPFYAQQGPVTTVKRAVFMLGWRSVRNIALTFAVRDALKKTLIPQMLMQQYWQQAVLRATTCQQLALVQRRVDPEEAFTIGLLQDLGLIVLFHLRPGHVAQMPTLMEMEPGERLRAEQELFGLTHVDVVRLLSEQWGLPSSLSTPIATHHDDTFPNTPDGEMGKIAAAADYACAVYSCSDKGQALRSFEEAMVRCGLGKDNVEAVLEQVSARSENHANALGISIASAPTYEQILFAANQTLMAIKDREEVRAQQLQDLLREKEMLTKQLERTLSNLEEMAYYDPLTGLSNRRRFDEVFLSQVARAQREGLPLSLLIIDIDHFKKVNDTWGHPCGDVTLKTVAQNITKCTRSTDHHARIGGEEMAMVLLGASATVGQNIAEKVRVSVSRLPMVYNDASFTVTVSIGGATFDVTKPPFTDRAPAEVFAGRLMQSADEALYASKQRGRNCVTWSGITPEAPKT